MIDAEMLEKCKQDKDILLLKIANLEYAIKQSEAIISESQMDETSLRYLRRKIAFSLQDLEVLYCLKNEQEAINDF